MSILGEVPAIEITGLRKLYNGFAAVDGLSITVPQGCFFGFLGPNGAGKTTTIKMLMGLAQPDAGTIQVLGMPLPEKSLEIRREIGLVPDDSLLFDYLTGAEYLEMVGHLRGLPERQLGEKIAGFLRLLSLYQDRYVPISSYSKGMRQKVLLIAALLHNPELVLLDEPFSGLDVNSALVLRDLIRELAARGKVVLFSSHDLETVQRVCSRVVILHKGRIVANDSIQQLRALMSLPTLEEIFSQLAVEQDTPAITQQLVQLMEW